jgi:hypothetical protein
MVREPEATPSRYCHTSRLRKMLLPGSKYPAASNSPKAGERMKLFNFRQDLSMNWLVTAVKPLVNVAK